MEISQALGVIFCILIFCIKANGQDSLKLSLSHNAITIDSNNWGLEFDIDSPDKTLYEIMPEDIIPSVSSGNYVCSLKRHSVYIFLYDLENEIIWPEFHYRCDSFYKDFSKSLQKKKIKVCLLDYSIGPGEYKIQLLFYSDKLDSCLSSGKIEFQVLPNPRGKRRFKG